MPLHDKVVKPVRPQVGGPSTGQPELVECREDEGKNEDEDKEDEDHGQAEA